MLGESREIKEAEAWRSATWWKAPALQGTLLRNNEREYLAGRTDAFPSFGHGIDAAPFDSILQRPRKPIWRSFFAFVNRLWTVLDGSWQNSPSFQ